MLPVHKGELLVTAMSPCSTLVPVMSYLGDELSFRPKDTPKFVKGRVRYIGACSVKGKQGVHV